MKLANPYNVKYPPRFVNDDFIKTLDLSIIDVETTGANLYGEDRICSIAVRRLKKGKMLKPIYTLIDPEMIIPPSASNVHGITNYLIETEKAPTLDKVLDQICDYVGDSIRVAHNAAFDRAFVNPAVFLENGYTRTKWIEPPESFEWRKQFQGNVGSEWLCTMRLAHHCFRAHFDYPECSIANNALRFWLEPKYTFTGMPHNALNDVQTTVHNLRHICSYANHAMGIDDINTLFALQNENIESGIMQFGKHEGELLTSIPDSYLKWLLTSEGTSYELGLLVDEELKNRAKNHRSIKDTYTQAGMGIFAGQYRSKHDKITGNRQFSSNYKTQPSATLQ